ncbi:MAG: serine/threonine-protein kinase [Actinoplanes sp.]
MAEDKVGGRYRLIEIIGVGGMGRVWRAEDELLRRVVAVKEIAAPAEAPIGAHIQTMREARAAARLDHPGVVKVYDVVWEPDKSWIVMEYVKSRSLREVIRTGGPLTHAEAARIGSLVLAALRAAHDAGVLHRDVKPQNVLLADDGRVVLGDFGLASTGDRDGVPDPLLGSPYYIAPERLRSGESGVPADLWSLGATLYTAIEGIAPFARADIEASLHAVLHEEPRPAESPGPLTPIIRGLLTKEPMLRLSAADLAADLKRVADDAPWRGRATVPTAARPRSRKATLTGAALAVLGLGAVAALTAAGLADAHPPTATFSPSASAVKQAPVAAILPGECGEAPMRPVTAATTRVPAGLPAGLVWFRDPAGFALAVPRGWLRATAGTTICYTDPSGRREFTVNTTALVTRAPLAYWQGREKAGGLPGYQRISMGVLLLKRGGADWEYTWRPDSDTVRHERRILLAVTDNRSYQLQWATVDAYWAGSVTLQRQMVNFFGSGS